MSTSSADKFFGRRESTLPPRVEIEFTSDRKTVRLFPSRAEAESWAKNFETWAYVARIRVLPSPPEGSTR